MKPIAERYIIVQFAVPGLHCWPDAVPEVEYLKNKHRHLFTYKVFLAVDHNQRDLEFFIAQGMMRRWVISAYENDMGGRSCEQLAEELGNYCWTKGWKPLSIEVWEDGENAGGVSWAD